MTDHNIDPNQLADLLDELLPPGDDTIPGDVEAADGLVQIAAALAAEPRPAPSFEAMARIQAKMLNAQHRAASAPTSAGRRILRLAQPLMSAVASVVLVLFFISPLVAESKPGDVLYGAKRAYERVELSLAGVRGNEASAHLSIAENRAREALKAVQSGDFNPELVEQVAQEISQAAGAAQKLNAPPSPELTAHLAEINSLVEFAIAEVQNRELAEAEIAQAAAAMNRVQLNGDMLALGVTDDALAGDDESGESPGEVVAPPEEAVEDTVSDETVSLVEDSEPLIMSIVGDGRVNVRSGPGMDFEIVLTLRPGSLVQVIETSEDGEWRRIRLPDGTEGWVADFLLGTRQQADAASTGEASSDAQQADESRDFGCGQRGNSCNAPGQQKDNPNSNGRES